MRMLQPRVAGRAALIAQGAHEVRGLVVIGDDDAAFAGGDLFVRVKREDAVLTHSACRFAFVRCTEGFAGIFDNGETVFTRHCVDGVHVGGLTEDVDGEDGF